MVAFPSSVGFPAGSVTDRIHGSKGRLEFRDEVGPRALGRLAGSFPARAASSLADRDATAASSGRAAKAKSGSKPSSSGRACPLGGKIQVAVQVSEVISL